VRLGVLGGACQIALYPGLLAIIPTRGFLGTVWSVSALLGHRSVCLGLPCKVYESIDCKPLTVIRDCLISWP
jgi:hypothetical protein